MMMNGLQIFEMHPCNAIAWPCPQHTRSLLDETEDLFLCVDKLHPFLTHQRTSLVVELITKFLNLEFPSLVFVLFCFFVKLADLRPHPRTILRGWEFAILRNSLDINL